MSNLGHSSSVLPTQDAALLTFFLGPVQPFIAGARTVRDLWTGSYLLAWLTFAAMRRVSEVKGSTMLSPSMDGNPLIRLEDRPSADELTTPCLPNTFTARLPSGVDAHALASACEQACHEEWDTICNQVHDRIGQTLERYRRDFLVNLDGRQVDLMLTPWDRLWTAQVQSFFEVRTVVLVPSGIDAKWRKQLSLEADTRPQEQVSREVLAALMGARKLTRHVPGYRPEGDVPQKCTLLGTYEQMVLD